MLPPDIFLHYYNILNDTVGASTRFIVIKIQYHLAVTTIVQVCSPLSSSYQSSKIVRPPSFDDNNNNNNNVDVLLLLENK
mmetsp:Transcript_37183/g.37656  ORF Transcript_37183/g.37656 Transcript_37183/m.37656 type:complete len:80 (-) Transcript_37183:354-593(-)